MKLSKPKRCVIEEIKNLGKGKKLVDIMKVMKTRRKPGQKQKSTRQLLIEFIEQSNKRFDKIEDILKHNNLK